MPKISLTNDYVQSRHTRAGTWTFKVVARSRHRGVTDTVVRHDVRVVDADARPWPGLLTLIAWFWAATPTSPRAPRTCSLCVNTAHEFTANDFEAHNYTYKLLKRPPFYSENRFRATEFDRNEASFPQSYMLRDPLWNDRCLYYLKRPVSNQLLNLK